MQQHWQAVTVTTPWQGTLLALAKLEPARTKSCHFAVGCGGMQRWPQHRCCCRALTHLTVQGFTNMRMKGEGHVMQGMEQCCVPGLAYAWLTGCGEYSTAPVQSNSPGMPYVAWRASSCMLAHQS